MTLQHKRVFTEEEARDFLKTHRDLAYANAFHGNKCQLTKKRSAIAADASMLAAAANDLGQSLGAAAQAAAPAAVGMVPLNELAEMVLKITALERNEWPQFAEMMAEELAVIGGKSLEAVASTFVPYFSTVVSAKNAVINWGYCAAEAHQAYKLQRTIGTDILPGNATNAANAVNQLIKRSSANHARLGAVHTVKFAVDTGASVGGFGAAGAVASVATGAAASAAILANNLFLLGRDYMEMKAANTMLENSGTPTSEELFSGCPLLGCYLICGADDSACLFFAVSAIGKKGFMDEVEKMKKQTLGPLQQTARQVIEDSRYELSGFKGKTFTVSNKKSLQVRAESAVRRVLGFGNKSFRG